MIDVAQYRAEISTIPGDSLILSRTQIHELLAALEAGQLAERKLRRITTIATLSATTALAA